MSKSRNDVFRDVVDKISTMLWVDDQELSDMLTSEIVDLQLLCDAELQDRADYHPDDDGGGNEDPDAQDR